MLVWLRLLHWDISHFIAIVFFFWRYLPITDDDTFECSPQTDIYCSNGMYLPCGKDICKSFPMVYWIYTVQNIPLNRSPVFWGLFLVIDWHPLKKNYQERSGQTLIFYREKVTSMNYLKKVVYFTGLVLIVLPPFLYQKGWPLLKRGEALKKYGSC